MSTPRQNPIPPELLKAMMEKPAEEQERIRRVWQLLGHLDPEQLDDRELNIPDTEEALFALENAIDTQPALPGPAFAEDRTPRARIRAMASGLPWITMTASVFLFLFAIMIWYWRAPVVIKADPGTQQVVELPDQSRVTLNSGSEIRYARRFESWPLIAANRRRVQLRGEAFFEVTKGEKAFVVESYNAHVRVLGTSFNVWARPHDVAPETRVTLATGEILVTSINDDTHKTTLHEAGQTARVFTTPEGEVQHVRDTVPVDRAGAWRNKGFAAVKMSAASIAMEIERRYNINIDIEPGVDAENTLTFFLQENPTPEDLLELMCLSMACQYRKTNTGFTIFK